MGFSSSSWGLSLVQPVPTLVPVPPKPPSLLSSLKVRNGKLRRTCVFVSNSSPGDAGGRTNPSENEKLSRSRSYSLLKQRLAVATNFEDYEEAARIRDRLRTFEEEEPVLRLRKLLRKAIDDERFEDAAKYRDELKEIAPYALLKCSSDATTLGIRVQVQSMYVESRSRPMEGQFFYAYRIRISNHSGRAVQLLRRHWIITDEWGRTEHVWGTGVVGQQPVIPPRAAFEYSSACPLGSPSGRMEGDFEMKPLLLEDHFADQSGYKKSIAESTNRSSFNVAIAPFSLSVLGDDLSSSFSSSAFLY